MKKIIVIALAAVLALTAFASCGKKETSSVSTDGSTSSISGKERNRIYIQRNRIGLRHNRSIRGTLRHRTFEPRAQG